MHAPVKEEKNKFNDVSNCRSCISTRYLKYCYSLNMNIEITNVCCNLYC